jgi:hypothetical protein
MPSTAVVSAEHAVECPVAGVIWQADITTITYTSNDHTLQVNARLLRLLPRSEERWQLTFAACAAHQFLPVGAPGNGRLTRPVQQQGFAPPPSVLYELANSDWLPSCQPVGGASGTLHHYVVVDDTENRALHVAATHVIGHWLEESGGPGAADQPRFAEALVAASERG